MFKAFKHGGVQYLAVNRGEGQVGIVDDAGNFYGSWYSQESFLEQAKKEPVSPIGKAKVSVSGMSA